MGLFTKKHQTSSSDTTLAPSAQPSVTNLDKIDNTDAVVVEKTHSISSQSAPTTPVTEEKKAVADTTIEKHDSNNTQEHQQTALGAEEKAAMQEDHDEDEIVYPKGLALVLITLALCLSVFLMALDNTIIATAIPKITDQFNSLADVGWYGSAYLLTTCSLQLFFGK